MAVASGQTCFLHSPQISRHQKSLNIWPKNGHMTNIFMIVFLTLQLFHEVCGKHLEKLWPLLLAKHASYIPPGIKCHHMFDPKMAKWQISWLYFLYCRYFMRYLENTWNTVAVVSGQTCIAYLGKPFSTKSDVFYTLCKRPLTPPPLVFTRSCCGFFDINFKKCVNVCRNNFL